MAMGSTGQLQANLYSRPNYEAWDMQLGEKQRHQADLFRQGQAGDTARANIAADASRFPAQLQQDRFNQVFPWLRNQYGQLGQGPFTAGGMSDTGPQIDTSPVWNPQQIQQRSNAVRGLGDQRAATQMRDLQQSMGGRGMGANSPLAMALGNQIQAANWANTSNQVREIQNEAAQANSRQRLGVNQLQEQRRGALADEDIRRRAPILGQQSQLLAALAGLV